MEQEKNKTIDKVLNSIHAIKQVEPSPFLLAKIRHRIEEKKYNSYLKFEIPIWKWAFTLAFIIAINLLGIFIYQPFSSQELLGAENEDVTVDLIAENYEDIY